MISYKIKWIKTIIIYLCIFLTSFCLRSFFSTLLDFTEILNSSLEIVSFGLSVRCFGGCVGSIVAGFLFNYADRLTVCAVFLMIGGISAASIPNVPFLSFYYLLKLMIGITGGVVRTGVVVMLANIWETKSRPFIQTYAFVQMLSAFVTPLIIHPFLSNDSQNTANETVVNVTKHNHSESIVIDFSHDITEDIKSEIWIPYASLGFAMSIAAFCALYLQLWTTLNSKSWSLNHEKLEENSKKENYGNTEEDRKTKHYWIIVFVCCSMIFVISALNIAFCQFWTTYVVYSDLEFSKAKGNLMLSAFALAMGCGTLCNIFISIKLKSLKMLVALVTLMLFGNIIILCYGRNSETMLWIGGIMVSAGVGPCVATIMNCLNERVKLTNITGSMASFSVNIAHACGLPVLIGHYIQRSPQILIHMNLAIIVIVILLLLSLRYIDSRLQRNILKEEIE